MATRRKRHKQRGLHNQVALFVVVELFDPATLRARDPQHITGCSFTQFRIVETPKRRLNVSTFSRGKGHANIVEVTQRG